MTMETYFAYRDGGGNSWAAVSLSEFLYELELWAEKHGNVYDSWSVGTQLPFRAAALSAGRTLTYKDGKYTAGGVEEAPMFRIGGVYRQNDGEVVELRMAWPLSKFQGIEFGYASRINTGGPDGFRRLDNGRYPYRAEDAGRGEHLIPGELEQDASGNWAKGATVSVSVRPLEYKPAPIAPTLHPADARMIARDGPAKPRAVQPAPVIAAKPAPAGLCFSTDLTRSSHQVSPFFGSAAL